MNKKEYSSEDFRNIVDTQLGEVKMTREMMHHVKEQSEKKRTLRSLWGQLGWYRITATALGAICIFAGTGYAITHVEGFAPFMNQNGLEKAEPYIQSVNQSILKGDVRVVVEEAITDKHHTLLVFSLINEGDAVWDEHTVVGSWEMGDSTMGMWGRPIISADGKKMTYYVEVSSGQDLSELQNLSLKVENVIEEKNYETPVAWALEALVGQGKVVSITDEAHQTSGELTRALDKVLKKEKSQGVVLDEASGLTFEYAGFIPDITDEEGRTVMEGGLVLYSRNQDKEFSTGRAKKNKLGCISELTDTRTGEVYKSSGREYRDDSLVKGAQSISIFPGITDEAMIPYLEVTKLEYDETNILVKDTWKVSFTLEQDEEVVRIPLDQSYTGNGITLHLSQAQFSLFGLTLEGRQEGRIIEPNGLTILDTLQVVLEMKDGERVTLVPTRGVTYMSDYVTTYSTSRDEVIWDIQKEEVKAIHINDQVITIS